MEIRNRAPNVVTLDPGGMVMLPREVLKTSRLGTGDLLFVV